MAKGEIVVNVKLEINEDTEQAIRRIVREEIAARKEHVRGPEVIVPMTNLNCGGIVNKEQMTVVGDSQNNDLIITKEGIFLNGSKIKDVFDYQVKSSAGYPTELTLKMYVSSSKILIDRRCNYTNGNLGQSIQ
ncbi:hypothetical protein K0T92_14520 [Paenibacillus oenotherae]|uniref:Uncharacterized protein n=1 Tax=Paenibacillus oenotherae TaxID=1435645 RepID=A0ABS7D7P6_9BACL|nr:hypothetical protein [Paenibacillus oenotherae]MBW7475957.1 hypothetical protein [Paenibacillus oenotherae]